MARTLTSKVQPAADAASLLRRLGFALLMLVIPVTALVTRRSIVILTPLAIILLVIAAALDGGYRPITQSARRVVLSPGGQAAALLLAWCALSLIWTPFVADASERLLHLIGTVSIALAGYLALPDRMRSANLYILPVGVALAAVLAIAIALFDGPVSLAVDDDGPSLGRGLIVLVLLLWPGIAWLRSRERDMEALMLAAAVTLAVVLGPQPLPLIALVVGAAVFALTVARPGLGVAATAFGLSGLLAAAPLMPFALRPLAAGLLGSGHPMVAALDAWRSVILSAPARLITGYGLETALRGRSVGLLPDAAPTTWLFGIWFELGIVGAVAGAVALDRAVRGAGHDHPPLVPGVMAAFASAFTFACLGIPIVQMWWFTALVVVILVFVAAERGQFRTKRPKAFLLRTARQRNPREA